MWGRARAPHIGVGVPGGGDYAGGLLLNPTQRTRRDAQRPTAATLHQSDQGLLASPGRASVRTLGIQACDHLRIHARMRSLRPPCEGRRARDRADMFPPHRACRGVSSQRNPGREQGAGLCTVPVSCVLPEEFLGAPRHRNPWEPLGEPWQAQCVRRGVPERTHLQGSHRR